MKDTIKPTKSQEQNDIKRYVAPDIERIKLDNDISLVLQSTPASPGGSPFLSKSDDANVNNPFKTGLG